MKNARPVSVVVYVFVALLCHQLLSTDANATVIYDTFRDDGGFSSNYGYIVHVDEPVGLQIIISGDTPIIFDGVELALKTIYWNGGVGLSHVRVTVRENSLNDEPAVVLDTMERDDIQASVPTAAAGTYSFVSEVHPVLQPGSSYWIVLENTLSGSVRPFWFLNITSAQDPTVEFMKDTGNWFHYASSYDSPVLRVNGTMIPEPTCLLLLVAGGLAVFARRRPHMV